jgi:16S rRNA processing protein RimM
MAPKAPKPTVGDELPVGRLAGLFGIHGELKCDPTRAGRALFTAGAKLRAQLATGASEETVVKSVREHQGRLLLRLTGAESPEEAGRFIGASLYAARERIRLERNEFFDADLSGCEIFDSGVLVGRVERVEHYPASDMLVVRGKLVPLIEEFVKTIDVEKKRIDVALPEGLLDD